MSGGAVIIMAGIACQIVQLVVSIRNCAQHRDLAGDPWNGRTLECSTASPPAAWNLAVLPHVASADVYWTAKRSEQANPAQKAPARVYEPIKMLRNSAIGFVNAFFAVVTGFMLIWHMWWMAALGLFGAFATFLLAFRGEDQIEIPAERIAQFERRPY